MDDLPSPSPQALPQFAQPPARKSHRWLFFLAAGLLLATVVCGVVAVVLLARSIGQAPANLAAGQKVIDQFMQAGKAQDVDAAYALFATNAQDPSRRTKITQLFGARNRVLFAGYQAVDVNDFHVSSGSAADANASAGVEAVFLGTLHYAGGRTGRIQAILEQQGDDWKLFDIKINAAPDKNHEES